MDELIETIDRISEIEKMLQPSPGEPFGAFKTISGKQDFETWKSEIGYQLQKLKQESIVVKTIELLDDKKWIGWKDESNFKILKANLQTIKSHLNELAIIGEEQAIVLESEDKKLKSGTTIKTAFDEYTLIKEVGSGGNGRVFSATNADGKSVAVKFVEKALGKGKLKRFKNEIHFCEQHKHKNLVEIIDRGYAHLDDKDYVFYVMPLYSQTLRSKMKAGIKPNDVVEIVVGILEGLEYAHKCGTIHRDIKPENIMFAEENPEPIICDFGIAHFAEDDLLTAVETKKGDRLANFQYAAPEQRIKGGNILPQTDIFAVGLILNEMFTGEIPQARGYTKIADINNDYKYLDDVSEKMFQQKAEDRIHPIPQILEMMNESAKQHNHHDIVNILENALLNINNFNKTKSTNNLISLQMAETERKELSQHIKEVREKIESTISALIYNIPDDYWNNDEPKDTFVLSKSVDDKYMQHVCSNLGAVIEKYYLAKTIPPSAVLDIDHRIKDNFNIPIEDVEKVFELYNEISNKYPSFVQSFYSTVANIINRNLQFEQTKNINDDYPF